MKRRTLFQSLLATLAVAALPATGILASPTIPGVEAEREYAKIAGIEVRITDMVGNSTRTVLAVSNKPILISEAKRPIAIILTEHDDDFVRMEVMEQDASGKWTRVSRSFAGRESTQVLRPYGIVIDIIAAAA